MVDFTCPSTHRDSSGYHECQLSAGHGGLHWEESFSWGGSGRAAPMTPASEPTPDVVEAVARALHLSVGGDPAIVDECWPNWADDARAAITAYESARGDDSELRHFLGVFIRELREEVPGAGDYFKGSEAARFYAADALEELMAENPPTVKPDGETVAQELTKHYPNLDQTAVYVGGCACGWEEPEDEWQEWSNESTYEQHMADAILALWPGRSEREVKVEALREAAWQNVPGELSKHDRQLVENWLNDRATALENGAGDE